jgi:hypothetical protein
MTTFKRHRGLTEQAADAAVDRWATWSWTAGVLSCCFRF